MRFELSSNSKVLFKATNILEDCYQSLLHFPRYRGGGEYSPQKYAEVTPYATPLNYSRLTRGASLQDVATPPSSTPPKLSRRVSRQSSLETDTPTLYGGGGTRHRGYTGGGPQEQLYYQELRRRYRRQGSDSGRGEGAVAQHHQQKKRDINCNKVEMKYKYLVSEHRIISRSVPVLSSVTGRRCAI